MAFTDQGTQLPYDWVPWLITISIVLFFAAIILKEYFKTDSRYLYNLPLFFVSSFLAFYMAMDLANGTISLHAGTTTTYAIYNNLSWVIGLWAFIPGVYFLIGVVEILYEYLSFIKL